MGNTFNFAFKDRGETLQYSRAEDVFLFDVTWSLHVRLFPDPALRSAAGRMVTGEERRNVLGEVLTYLRTQTTARIEVVGQPGLGDQVSYSIAELSAKIGDPDSFVRNSAVHELANLAGEDAARLWYRVVREDPASLCVSSAFHFLMKYAGVDAPGQRELLFILARSVPSSSEEHRQALDRLDELLNEKLPGIVSRIRTEPA